MSRVDGTKQRGKIMKELAKKALKTWVLVLASVASLMVALPFFLIC